jgi:serine/threonine-protein phosphatase 6 regulatory subunit 3
MLSPSYSSDVHGVVSDLLKNIITMSAPSPTQSALSDGLQNGPASNRFARELAVRSSVSHLLDFMLQSSPVGNGHDKSLISQEEVEERQSSSVINSMSVVIELIRKNNSDYFEPFLFHTLRNRLIQVQQTLHSSLDEDPRQVLERAMQELTDKIGVVHLGSLLDVMALKLPSFKDLLEEPRLAVSANTIRFCHG